jgi:ribonuclease P protein subunit RPR2
VECNGFRRGVLFSALTKYAKPHSFAGATNIRFDGRRDSEYSVLVCLTRTSLSMAKVKSSKGAGGVTNKALHSRVSFLYQAAAYLATREPQCHNSSSADGMGLHQDVMTVSQTASQDDIRLPSHALSRRYISDLRAVSLKTQIRLSPSIKHSICKRCDIMLIDGSTCACEVENKSKGGSKPWADVLVRRCKSCGYERKFPCEAKRQARRPRRLLKSKGC